MKISKIEKMCCSSRLFCLSKNPPETDDMLSYIGCKVGFDYDYVCAVDGEDKANAGLLLRLSELIDEVE